MSARVVRWILRLYPSSFRAAWSRDVLAMMDARQAGDHARSRMDILDAVRMLPRAWTDHFTNARNLDHALAMHDPHRRTSWFARRRDMLRQDLRYTFGQGRAAPAFTLCAIITLAVGMGAAIAIFSVLNAVLLRPMPYRDADRVAITTARWPFWADIPQVAAVPEIERYATWQGWRAAFPETDGSVGVRLSAAVSPEFFDLLGVHPVLGRLFDSRDAAAAGNPIILSYATWQKDFGGARDVIGRGIPMDNVAYTVVGVLPRDFADPLAFPVNDIESAMFRVLVPPPEGVRTRPGPAAAMVIRLRPGSTVATLSSSIRRVLTPQYEKSTDIPDIGFVGAQEARVSSAKSTLLVLAGAVALLVLIGCANAANLLLSRAGARRREMTVRGALGAARGRLIAQLLTESLVLAMAAGAVGLWIGRAGADAIVRIGDVAIPRGEGVRIDRVVLLFTAFASFGTALLFGLLPALQGSRVSYGAALRDARGMAGARGGSRMRNLLVVSEIAVAVMLTFGAGLLVRSLWKLNHVQPGYDSSNVLTLRVTFNPSRFDIERRVALHDAIATRIAQQPGVVAAAAVTYHPLSGGDFEVPISLQGDDAQSKRRAQLRSVTSGFFDALHIRLVAGRSLLQSDNAGGAKVIVVNRAFAQHYFGSANPLGRMVRIADVAYSVVGVSGDVREFTLASEDARPTVYVSYAQTPEEMLPPSSSILVRGTGDAHALAQTARAAIRDIEPTAPIAFIRTMRDMMNIDLLAPRLRTVIIACFGALAAVLAALGIAGVMSCSVAETMPEISVRMALGARRGQVAARVLGLALRLSVTGLLLGSVLALLAGRVVRNMLYDVPATDTLVLASVALATIAVAILATWIPARRAMRAEPAAVLRTL